MLILQKSEKKRWISIRIIFFAFKVHCKDIRHIYNITKYTSYLIISFKQNNHQVHQMKSNPSTMLKIAEFNSTGRNQGNYEILQDFLLQNVKVRGRKFWVIVRLKISHLPWRYSPYNVSLPNTVDDLIIHSNQINSNLKVSPSML